ncbi:hypothetical protein CKO51_05255 [Rhodopirellula sp. SM50]|nr:hypothetical protein CKO51_05255 [Rhodopirellula sp. SM50]
MFARILIAVSLVSAGGQLVSAGMIVSCDERFTISVEQVAKMAIGNERDAPTFVRSFDSQDQSCGSVSNSVSNGSSSAVLSPAAVLPLNFSCSAIRFANALLPRPPCLEGLFKPV